MTKLITTLVALLILGNAYAQSTDNDLTEVISIQRTENGLIINQAYNININDEIQVYLPAGKDFVFINRKKSKLNAKLVGGIADAVGAGASVIGVGSRNTEVIQGAVKVMRTARTVEYGADAIDKINDLPISQKAKKIAGKMLLVQEVEFREDGWYVIGEIENKKYEIYLQEALAAGEVKIE